MSSEGSFAMARPAITPHGGDFFTFTVGRISGDLQVDGGTVEVNAHVDPPANPAAQGPFPIVLAEEIIITGVRAEHLIDFLI
jgi:hypothetical protein